MINATIFTLWGLSIAAEIGLIVVLLRQRLAARYPGVTLWAMASAASGLATAWAYFIDRSYAAQWAAWEPVSLAAMILLTADVAYQVGRQWPARGLAIGVNVLFGSLSLAAMGWIAHLFPANAWGAAAAMLRLKEHFALACALTILANWAIYSIPQPEWRKNTKRHVRAAFALTLGLGLAVLLVAWHKSYATIAVANTVISGLPLCCCVIWARMSRQGEEYSAPRPQGNLLENLEALDRMRIDR